MIGGCGFYDDNLLFSKKGRILIEEGSKYSMKDLEKVKNGFGDI
jgi:hypothetical protein